VYQKGRQAPAVGVPVRLMAWPRSEVVRDLAVGESLSLKPIGWTTTDDSGSFVLRVAPSIDLGEFTSEGGDIDVDLMVDSPHGVATWEATIPRDLLAGSVLPDPNDDEFGSMPRNLDLELTESASGEIDVTRMATLNSDTQEEVEVGTLGVVGDFSTRVGFINKVGSTATVWFQYSYGDSSTLGVGISYNKGLSWSANGTSTRDAGSVSSPAGVTDSPNNLHYYTKFRYSTYIYYSGCGGFESYRKVRASDHAGGMTRVTTSALFTGRYCERYHRGTYTFTRTRAYTWSTGVNSSATIGIDLSARTGYTEGASMRFEHRTDLRDICGEFDKPGITSGTVGRMKSVYRG
jgi:hypothetical protein